MLRLAPAWALWSIGCAGATASAPVAETPSAPAQQQEEQPAAPRTVAELEGAWVQYWAPSGQADTQRYVFTADGRFTWSAPKDAPSEAASTKAGQFGLEQQGKVWMLLLQVQTEELAACSDCCGSCGNDAPHQVQHEPALTERLELGECAHNDEAQAVDASYACLAIGGHAFWRRPGAGTVPPPPSE